MTILLINVESFSSARDLAYAAPATPSAPRPLPVLLLVAPLAY